MGEEDDKNQPTTLKSMQQGPVGMSSASQQSPSVKPVQSISAPPTKQPAKPPAVAQRGTGFTNIGKILQANVGGRTAQAVTSGVQQVGQKAGQAIGQARQQFGQAMQKADIGSPEQQKELQGVLSRVQQGGQPTEAEVTKFGQYLKGQYTGPMSLSQAGDQTLGMQAQQAQQLGQFLGTPQGKGALLERFAAGAGQKYSAGQKMLDLALLGQQGSSQALRQARQQALSVAGQYQTAEQAAQTQAQEAQARAAAIQQMAQTGIAAQANPLEQKLQKRASIRYGEEQQELKGLVEKLRTGQISAEELKSLGLSELEGTKGFFGAVDTEKLGEYFSPVEAATKASVASETEAGKMSALSKLMGKAPGEFADVSKIGKYGTEPFKGSQQTLVERVKQKEAEYEGKIAEHVKNTGDTLRLAEQGYNNAVIRMDRAEKQINAAVTKFRQQGLPDIAINEIFMREPQLAALRGEYTKQKNIADMNENNMHLAYKAQKAGIEKLQKEYHVFDKGFGK